MSEMLCNLSLNYQDSKTIEIVMVMSMAEEIKVW